MNNKAQVIGKSKLGNMSIDVISVESCFRLSQYGQGSPITCRCTSCAKRNQTPEEAKKSLDKAHGKES
jgi:hypothetical protein